MQPSCSDPAGLFDIFKLIHPLNQHWGVFPKDSSRLVETSYRGLSEHNSAWILPLGEWTWTFRYRTRAPLERTGPAESRILFQAFQGFGILGIVIAWRQPVQTVHVEGVLRIEADDRDVRLAARGAVDAALEQRLGRRPPVLHDFLHQRRVDGGDLAQCRQPPFNATEHLRARVAPGSLPFETTAHPLIGVLAAPAGQSSLVSVAREGAGEHEQLKSSADAIDLFGQGGARIAGKRARRGEACERRLVAHDDPERRVDAVSELAV